MGRGILIVGAGQSGLMLAHGLLDHGYDVTVATGSSSTDIRTGRVSVTQLTMPTVRAMEQAADLDLWSGQAPEFGGVRISMRPPQQQATQFSGRFGGGAGVAVDRRLKMADWLEKFEDRGGKVIVHGMTTEDIDFFTRRFALAVLAVGRGEPGHPMPAAAVVRPSGCCPRSTCTAWMPPAMSWTWSPHPTVRSF